jgi:hypothetical protein
MIYLCENHATNSMKRNATNIKTKFIISRFFLHSTSDRLLAYKFP